MNYGKDDDFEESRCKKLAERLRRNQFAETAAERRRMCMYARTHSFARLAEAPRRP